MTIKRLEPLNGKALMYVFLWKVTYAQPFAGGLHAQISLFICTFSLQFFSSILALFKT